MHNSVDHYYTTLEEPERSCLLFLRKFILEFSDTITERRTYNTPFYYHNLKSIGFMSYDPKTKEIYISFTNGNKIEHPELVSEGRKKMKIFRVDPAMDIDLQSLREILAAALVVK